MQNHSAQSFRTEHQVFHKLTGKKKKKKNNNHIPPRKVKRTHELKFSHMMKLLLTQQQFNLKTFIQTLGEAEIYERAHLLSLSGSTLLNTI